MAIDYIIDYDCIPKQTLGTDGILNRIKGVERARTIIELYRQHDDERSPSEMGFEFSQSMPDGETEKRIVYVKDLLDAGEELNPLGKHCQGCPANRSGSPFGCMGFIQYPISSEGEKWLLDRLPTPPQAPLIWLLLKQGVDNFAYDGNTVRELRSTTDTYFEDRYAAVRRLGEFVMSADQVFEMVFTVGNIQPNHGGVLLLLFGAIPRDLDAPEIMHIAPAGPDAEEKHPFQIEAPSFNDDTDATVNAFKEFLQAVYVAWKLNVPLLVDS